MRTILLAPLALLALTATPAAANNPTECVAVGVQCATASASWFGAYSCNAVPPGEPAAACAGHGTSGYVFGLTCSGNGTGPVTVVVTGCGTSSSGVLSAAVSSSWWHWDADALDVCHTATVTAVFNGFEGPKPAEHTFCVSLT